MGLLYQCGNNTVHIKHNESKIKISYMEKVLYIKNVLNAN